MLVKKTAQLPSFVRRCNYHCQKSRSLIAAFVTALLVNFLDHLNSHYCFLVLFLPVTGSLNVLTLNLHDLGCDIPLILIWVVLIFVGWGSASSMAARYDCSDSAPSSLPSPFPKSPPEYPDLYGKRREMAKIQVLEREIGYLEAELKSVDGLQPASRSCKEIVDFVAANSDPLIPTLKKHLRRYHRFRKWLGGLPRFDLSRIYCSCYSGCDFQIQTPRSCHCCNFDGNWIPSCPADCLRWRPTTPNCLSCTLPDCLQCRPTPLNCLSCALPEPLQWQPNWFCRFCPDLHRCKNTSFGRLCHSSLPDCTFTKCKCLCYCPECTSIHPFLP